MLIDCIGMLRKVLIWVFIILRSRLPISKGKVMKM